MNKLSAIATFCGHSDSASEIAPAFRIDQDEGNSHKTNKFELESAHANGGGGLSPLDLGAVRSLRGSATLGMEGSKL